MRRNSARYGWGSRRSSPRPVLRDDGRVGRGGGAGDGTYTVSTGNVLPGTSTAGHPPKYRAKSSRFIVADMMTSRKEGLRARTPRRSPRRRSTSARRSCASSTMTTSWESTRSGSSASFRKSVPSVRKTHLVARETVESNRIWCATSSPRSVSISRATRRASATAATRRGCVHATRANPARIRYCGTCVDFPHPVSPAMSVTGCARTEATMASISAAMGRFALALAMSTIFAS